MQTAVRSVCAYGTEARAGQTAPRTVTAAICLAWGPLCMRAEDSRSADNQSGRGAVVQAVGGPLRSAGTGRLGQTLWSRVRLAV